MLTEASVSKNKTAVFVHVLLTVFCQGLRKKDRKAKLNFMVVINKCFAEKKVIYVKTQLDPFYR